jgi:endoglycosylceramidase
VRGSRATGLALAALLFALLAAPAGATGPGGPTPQLGHHGRWITDARGRVVILHGVNMVNKRAPYTPSATGFGDDDARFLAHEGYNTVRVGLIYKAIEPKPGTYDDAYLADVRNTVDTLARHGIYSLLDFHQDLYNERFFGEGWPDWAVQDDGLPNQPNLGFPYNYFGMPALIRAFDHFWANSPGPREVGLQNRYAAAWRHVARLFRDHPHVVGYDLMNEPWPGTPWATCANTQGCPAFDAVMTRFWRRTIREIRRVDPDTLAWYEPTVLFNFGSNTNVGSVRDPHAGFSFHDYCLAGTPQSCDVFDDMVFANARRHGKTMGSALMLTEFGATDDLESLRLMVERADESMIPWQEWHYCGCADPTTSGPGATQAMVLDPAQPPVGANLKRAKLRVLSRAYPQTIAGRPRGWSFDQDSRTFRMTYTTEAVAGGTLPADLQTVIAAPRRQYSDGYAVEVHGARVTSTPGAERLRLTNCRGIHDVSVTVTPGAGPTQQSC